MTLTRLFNAVQLVAWLALAGLLYLIATKLVGRVAREASDRLGM